MKRNAAWVKSLLVSLIVLSLMSGAGFYFLNEAESVDFNQSTVEASGTDVVTTVIPDLESAALANKNPAKISDDLNFSQPDLPSVINLETPLEKQDEAGSVVVSSSENTSAEVKAEEQPVVIEAKADAPAVTAQTTEENANQTVISSAPVSYSWGANGSYTFRMEVKVTNNGSDTSKNVAVSVPMLENSSPYQTTSLKNVNYEIVSTSGRVSTFNLGDLAPGESKTIIADFSINTRSVSLTSTNDTVEKARRIYEKHAGPGNCRDLALAFIRDARAQGLNAREVIGFARPQRGEMTSGSLQGTRHSWAEFYVDGLGWVPVDLTFEYFGAFPQTSHIVESYADQSIKVNYSGGSLSASWSNAIL